MLASDTETSRGQHEVNLVSTRVDNTEYCQYFPTQNIGQYWSILSPPGAERRKVFLTLHVF